LARKPVKGCLQGNCRNHTIEMKKGFVSRKGKVYLLLREEREEICMFIAE